MRPSLTNLYIYIVASEHGERSWTTCFISKDSLYSQPFSSTPESLQNPNVFFLVLQLGHLVNVIQNATPPTFLSNPTPKQSQNTQEHFPAPQITHAYKCVPKTQSNGVSVQKANTQGLMGARFPLTHATMYNIYI